MHLFIYGGKGVKNYRYGVFNPKDFCLSWFGIVALLIFAIASFILNLSLLFIVFPIIYSLIWLWAIVTPYREQFVICEDSITMFRGKTRSQILLPCELTLIVSCADICPPLAIRTPIGNQTHILKNKCAVSILKKIPLDITLEKLHRVGSKYTTSTIQTAFDNCCYIYGFVCDQNMLDTLMSNRDCSLIIPESLVSELSFDSHRVNVYIDRNH